MSAMTVKGNKGATHELKDLEVREVSVVDRPANQRPFLIVKNEGGSAMASEVTADLSILSDAADLISLLDFDDESPEPKPAPEPQVNDLGGLEMIFKATTAGQAVKQLAPTLQRLLDLVNGMKKLGDKPVPAAVVSQLKGVIGALNLLSGKANAETQKLEASTLQQATKALEKLVALVSALKAADSSTELGEKEASEMSSIASLLSSLTVESAAPDKAKPDEKDPSEKSDKDETIIVLKAGAKMKKVRLSQFRKAVDTLMSLLKELEGEPPVADDKKGKKKTTKTDEPVVPAEPQEPAWLSKMEERADKSIQATEALTSKVEDLVKRVDGIENARPVGADDDPPTDPIEKKQSLWGGIIGAAK